MHSPGITFTSRASTVAGTLHASFRLLAQGCVLPCSASSCCSFGGSVVVTSCHTFASCDRWCVKTSAQISSAVQVSPWTSLSLFHRRCHDLETFLRTLTCSAPFLFPPRLFRSPRQVQSAAADRASKAFVREDRKPQHVFSFCAVDGCWSAASVRSLSSSN